MQKERKSACPQENVGQRGNVWPPWCLTKNLNALRPSEHPPVRGEKTSKRLGGIIGSEYKTSS